MPFNPINTAPTDGTRILARVQVTGFVPERHGSPFRVHTPIGSRWVEARFYDGRWQEWRGRENYQHPDTLVLLEWTELPC